jgi:hypothetical protein
MTAPCLWMRGFCCWGTWTFGCRLVAAGLRAFGFIFVRLLLCRAVWLLTCKARAGEPVGW